MKSPQWTMVLAALAFTCQAQNITLLHSFSLNPSIEGYRPESTMVQGGGTLYGTTVFGALSGRGTVYKVNTDGTGFAVLHSSAQPDWMHPNTLILDGTTLYGTTRYGDDGTGLWIGTVFKLNTDGSGYLVLKTFRGFDGKDPIGGLVKSGDVLYGATSFGGVGDGGTIFRVNTDGSGFTVIHEFGSTTYPDTFGVHPNGDLVLAGSTLYGTTMDGGSSWFGTVFKVETNGTGFTVLHHFIDSEGSDLRAGLLLSGDTLFGTASRDGGDGFDGTVFKLKTNGDGFAVLHRFIGTSFDMGPWAGLIARGNTLYGTTSESGGPGPGTVFRLAMDGSDFAIMRDFAVDDPDYTNGKILEGGLVSDGRRIYGVAAIGGSADGGTVFGLDLPSPPAPLLASVEQTNGTFSFSWNAEPGSSYQVQYASDPNASNWNNLGGTMVASNSSLSASDFIGSNSQRFYRVILLP